MIAASLDVASSAVGYGERDAGIALACCHRRERNPEHLLLDSGGWAAPRALRPAEGVRCLGRSGLGGLDFCSTLDRTAKDWKAKRPQGIRWEWGKQKNQKTPAKAGVFRGVLGIRWESAGASAGANRCFSDLDFDRRRIDKSLYCRYIASIPSRSH